MSYRRHLHTVDAALQSAFQAVWGLGFDGVGRMFGRNPAAWETPGAQRVLVVAPHPDDEVAGCAGAICRHRRRGDTVHVVHVTDGRRSRALGLPPAEMAVRRRAEADAAAGLLGVDGPTWLGLPEGHYAPTRLREALAATIGRVRPDVLYAPSCVDFHPEHRQVAQMLATLLQVPAGGLEDPTIRIYPVQVPLTALLANVVLDVSDDEKALRAALDAYESQRDSLQRTVRLRRYAARYYGAGVLAETFWQVTPAQYRLLHASSAAMPHASPFRGLRHRAFTDPLAYLRGRAARRALAGRVGRDVLNAERQTAPAGSIRVTQPSTR